MTATSLINAACVCLRARCGALAALLALLPVPHAFASGTLPPIPQPPVRFASYPACVASLERLYLEHRAQVDARPVRAGDAATRQRMLDTDGIHQTGRRRARYAAQLGAEFRRLMEDGRTLETNFTYDTFRYTCAGPVRTGEIGGGFYLPGYETLDASHARDWLAGVRRATAP